MSHSDRIVMLVLAVMMTIQTSSVFAQRAAQPTGEWEHVAFFQNDGGFGHCIARNTYDNQYSLLFALTQQQELVLLIGIPQEQLQIGQEIPMVIGIDRQIRREVKGIVTSSERIDILLGMDEAFYQGVMDGVTLFITRPEKTVKFALRQTRSALTTLRECTQVRGVNFTAIRQPPSDDTPPPAIPPFITQTFRTIGLDVFPVAQRSGRVALFFGHVIGPVDIVQIPPDKTRERVITEYIDLIKQRECQGAFAQTMQPLQHYDQSIVQIAEATCRNENDVAAQYISWIFQRTPQNILYIYTVTGSITQQIYADSLRNLILVSIINQLTPPDQQ